MTEKINSAIEQIKNWGTKRNLIVRATPEVAKQACDQIEKEAVDEKKRHRFWQRGNFGTQVITIDCNDLRKDGLADADMIERIKSGFERVSKPRTLKNKGIIRHSKNLEVSNSITDYVLYLAEIAKVNGYDHQTILATNLDTLPSNVQMSVAALLMKHLSNNSRINAIVFHEKDIKTFDSGLPLHGLHPEEGHAIYINTIEPPEGKF